MGKFCRVAALLACLFMLTQLPASAGDDETTKEPITGMTLDSELALYYNQIQPPHEHYTFVRAGQVSYDKHLITEDWVGWGMGGLLLGDRLWLERCWHWISLVKLDDYHAGIRFAVTPVVQLFLMWLLRNEDEDHLANSLQSWRVLPWLLMGPRLVYYVGGPWQLYAGYQPELVLFTHSDGLLLRYQLGMRATFMGKASLGIHAERYTFLSFDNDHPDLGWGIGFTLGFFCGQGFGMD